MKSKNYSRLKGSSLIESIIAIAIISICILLGVTIYSNVLKYDNINIEVLNNHVELDFQEMKLNTSYKDKNYNYKEYTIRRKVNMKDQLFEVEYLITNILDTLLQRKYFENL